MTQHVFRAFKTVKSWVFLTFSVCLMSWMIILDSQATVMPGGNSGWLVVASRQHANEAVSIAQGYSRNFPKTTVFQSNNGWYAITIGWMSQPAGNTYRNRLISSGAIPGDSYFHNGQRFQYVVWSATGVSGSASPALFTATRINGSPPVQSERGYVTGLNPRGDNFLSLRTGPSSRYQEIARMGPNTRLTILGRSGAWLNVALASGRTGWAHSRYIASLPVNTPIVSPPVTTPPIVTPPAAAKRTISPPRTAVVGDLTRSGDSFLSLRTGAGSNFQEIARLLEGTEVQMLAQQDAWVEIEISNGMRGWAHGSYLKAPDQKVVQPDIPVFGPENDPVKPDDLNDLVANLPDGKRVALVIGNSAYEHTTALENPKNDAADLTATLKRLGFTVLLGLDQSKVDMDNTVRSFVQNISGADVALFFYAGHAMQVDGKNYLVPIDAKFEDSTAIDFETVELGTILNYMNAPGRLSIALLDACRDNPLSRRFYRSLGQSRQSFAARGLAAPEAGGGNVLIGFATAPGDVALDGDTDNSPFTTALLNHIETPGLEIEIMMKRVKAEVFALTRGEQSPWHNSALRDEFYFVK